MDDLAAAERTIKNANKTQFSNDCKPFFMKKEEEELGADLCDFLTGKCACCENCLWKEIRENAKRVQCVSVSTVCHNKFSIYSADELINAIDKYNCAAPN